MTNKSFMNVTRLTIQWHLLVFRIISKLDIFPWCVLLIKSRSLNRPWSTKILASVQTHLDVTDKNNSDSFEDFNIHYHSSSYQTCCDVSNNVCLDLQNCCYSYVSLNMTPKLVQTVQNNILKTFLIQKCTSILYFSV